MNKRNSVPFHPCSTVTNQREVAVQLVFVQGFLNKIHNKSSGTGTVTDSNSLERRFELITTTTSTTETHSIIRVEIKSWGSDKS